MSFKIEKTRLSDFIFSKKTDKTRVENLPQNCRRFGFRNGKHKTLVGWSDGEYVYGANSQKARRKTKVAKERNTQESGCGSFYKRELVREAHWVTTVYKFPIDRVKHFEQHKHHFDVTLY